MKRKTASLSRASSQHLNVKRSQRLSARLLPDFSKKDVNSRIDQSDDDDEPEVSEKIAPIVPRNTKPVIRKTSKPILPVEPTSIDNNTGDDSELEHLRSQLLQVEDSKKQLIAKHQQGVADLRAYYDNELEEKNDLISKFEQELSQARTAKPVADSPRGDDELWNKKIAQIEASKLDLENIINQKSIEIGQLYDDIKEKDFKLKRRENEATALNNTITNHQNETIRNKEVIARLEEQLADAAARRSDLEMELKDYQNRGKTDQMSFTIIDNLKRDVMTYKFQVDQLEREKSLQLDRMRPMVEEMNEMSSIIKQLSKDKEFTMNESIRLSFMLESTRNELALVRQQQREKQATYKEALTPLAIPPPAVMNERDMEMAIMKYANKYFTVSTPVQQYSPVVEMQQQSLSKPPSPKFESDLIHNRNRVMQPSPVVDITDQSVSTPRGNLHSNAPFATDQTLRDAVDATAAIEDQLIELSLEKNSLDGEYQKLMSSNLKTIKSRKRKMEIEQRLEAIARKGSDLRLELKKQLANTR
jgi:hypothetical protein